MDEVIVKIRQDNARGEEHISIGSATSLLQGGGAPALPNFGSFLLFV